MEALFGRFPFCGVIYFTSSQAVAPESLFHTPSPTTNTTIDITTTSRKVVDFCRDTSKRLGWAKLALDLHISLFTYNQGVSPKKLPAECCWSHGALAQSPGVGNPLATGNPNQTLTRNCFFVVSLTTTLSGIKRFQVMSMGKVGPTVINFGIGSLGSSSIL